VYSRSECVNVTARPRMTVRWRLYHIAYIELSEDPPESRYKRNALCSVYAHAPYIHF